VRIAYGPADATAIPKTPSPLASSKSRLVLPFCYWFSQVVLEKRPLNGVVNFLRSSDGCCYKAAVHRFQIATVVSFPGIILHLSFTSSYITFNYFTT